MKTLRRILALLPLAVLPSLLSACGDSSEIEDPLATTTLEDVQLVDPAGTTNMGFPLVFDEQGDPHIAYIRSGNDYALAPGSGNSEVIYAHRSGAFWNVETVIKDGDYRNGLALVLNGSQEPVLTYQRMLTPYEANLEIAERASGVWSADTIDTDGWCGSQTSIQAFPSSLIRVAYFAGYPYYDLRYAERIDGEWTRTTVDSVESAGYYPGLASNENGDPVIVYAADHVGLRFATRTHGVWASQTLESGTYTGSGLTLAIDANSGFHISYASDTGFKYARKSTQGPWHFELIEPLRQSANALVLSNAGDPWFVSIWSVTTPPHILRIGTRHDGQWFFKTFPEIGELENATLAQSPDGRLGLAYVTKGDSLFFGWVKP